MTEYEVIDWPTIIAMLVTWRDDRDEIEVDDPDDKPTGASIEAAIMFAAKCFVTRKGLPSHVGVQLGSVVLIWQQTDTSGLTKVEILPDGAISCMEYKQQ